MQAKNTDSSLSLTRVSNSVYVHATLQSLVADTPYTLAAANCTYPEGMDPESSLSASGIEHVPYAYMSEQTESSIQDFEFYYQTY